jgi:hypothetical protein
LNAAPVARALVSLFAPQLDREPRAAGEIASRRSVGTSPAFLRLLSVFEASYRRYGISGYYEDESDWLISESGRIWKLLTS